MLFTASNSTLYRPDGKTYLKKYTRAIRALQQGPATIPQVLQRLDLEELVITYYRMRDTLEKLVNTNIVEQFEDGFQTDRYGKSIPLIKYRLLPK